MGAFVHFWEILFNTRQEGFGLVLPQIDFQVVYKKRMLFCIFS